MTTSLYDFGREAILRNVSTDATGDPGGVPDPAYVGLQLDAQDLKASLVHGAYTHAPTHRYWAEVLAQEQAAGVDDEIATATMPGSTSTVTGGIYDNANTTWTAPPAGAAFVAVILWRDTGNVFTSPLVAHIDEDAVSLGDSLPVTPNGTDITITWNATGIFKL